MAFSLRNILLDARDVIKLLLRLSIALIWSTFRFFVPPGLRRVDRDIIVVSMHPRVTYFIILITLIIIHKKHRLSYIRRLGVPKLFHAHGPRYK